jgi:hypothetical protein
MGQLLTDATGIRDESVAYANTAYRVGKWMLDALAAIGDKGDPYADLVAGATAVRDESAAGANTASRLGSWGLAAVLYTGEKAWLAGEFAALQANAAMIRDATAPGSNLSPFGEWLVRFAAYIENEEPFILVSPSAITLPPSGAPGVLLAVTANTPWVIHGKSDWIDAVVTKDGNNGTIAVTSSPNITGQPRGGIVLVATPSQSITRTITVMQDIYTPGTGISTDPEREDFGSQAYSNVSVTVDSDLPWSVASFPGWTGVTKFNNTYININVEANDGPYRTGVIALTNGENNVEFPLAQDGTTPGDPILALEPDGSINEGDGSLVLDDVPVRVAGRWGFYAPVTGEWRGLDVSPAASDVPWHTLVMELDVSHTLGSGGLLSVPVGPGRRARFSVVTQSTVRLEIVQDGEVVHSEDMPVSSGAFTLTIGRVEGNLVAGADGTIYSEALVGAWFIGSEMNRRLYAGPNRDGETAPVVDPDTRLYRVELY